MSAVLKPLECPGSDVASVPRRFGVGVLLILVTAFAALFAAMRSLNFRPKVFGIFGLLFLGVTLGQISLFKGRRPHLASLLVGGVLLPLEFLIADHYVIFGIVYGLGNLPGFWGGAIRVLLALLGVAIGALVGYLVGCIMAGVFFVQEKIRRRLCPPLKIKLLPFTVTDFDTLIGWGRQPRLLNLWSRSRFRYPLDHQQLAAHLGWAADDSYKPESPARDGNKPDAQARDEEVLLADPRATALSAFPGGPADRRCFKAVCGEMQEMVGYAELVDDNREMSRANIELAIIDPLRNDRDHLSDVLVREIVQHAFDQQGLQSLGVVLHHSEVQSLECFRKHGFCNELPKSPGGPRGNISR